MIGPRASPVGVLRSLLTSDHEDATGLSRGVSRSLLHREARSLQDATGLSRGVSRSLLTSAAHHQDAMGLSVESSR
jgi:hypothetical protein